MNIQMHNQLQTNSQYQQGNISQITGAGGTSPNQIQPNYQYYPYYIQNGNNYNTISKAQIEQVENGWLVIKDGKVYVCVIKEDIVKYL